CRRRSLCLYGPDGPRQSRLDVDQDVGRGATGAGWRRRGWLVPRSQADRRAILRRARAATFGCAPPQDRGRRRGVDEDPRRGLLVGPLYVECDCKPLACAERAGAVPHRRREQHETAPPWLDDADRRKLGDEVAGLSQREPSGFARTSFVLARQGDV